MARISDADFTAIIKNGILTFGGYSNPIKLKNIKYWAYVDDLIATSKALDVAVDVLKEIDWCANKNKKELYAYYKYLPEYWARLKDLQHKIGRPLNRQTIDELEEEFKKKENQ